MVREVGVPSGLKELSIGHKTALAKKEKARTHARHAGMHARTFPKKTGM